MFEPRKRKTGGWNVPKVSLLSTLFLVLAVIIINPRCILNTTGLAPADNYSAGPPPDGCAGEFYSYDLNSYFDVSGLTPPLDYQHTGDLPPGLSLDAATGLISGTVAESAAGHEYEFTVTVADSDSPEAEYPQASFRIRIFNFAIVTPRNALPSVCIGSPYSFEIVLCGGEPPFAWSISDWNPEPLPFSFAEESTDERRNVIATPPEPFAYPPGARTYSFRVTVTEGGGETTERVFYVTTLDELNILGPRTLPDGRLGQPYEHAFEACGGDGDIEWTITDGSVPGLAITPGTSRLSGTPTASGTFWFTVRATDATGEFVEDRFSIFILSPLTVDNPIRLSGIECTVFRSDLTYYTDGGMGTQHWELDVGPLPPGLTLETDGTLSGQITRSGTYIFSVRVFDESTDPLSPPTSTLRITVSPEDADSGLTIERVRQANPAGPEYPGDNILQTSLAEAVRIDLVFTDAAWGDAWYLSATKQASVRIIGLCGREISTTNIGLLDVDADGTEETVLRFAETEFFSLIDEAGGVAGSPYQMRVILNYIDNIGNKRVGTTAPVIIRVARPAPAPWPNSGVLTDSPHREPSQRRD